jgi:hypothetical protein
MALGLSVNRELRQVNLEVLMRSDLVFGAMKDVPNRYLLSQLVSKAARKLHRTGTRMQDTTNDVLMRFSRANPIGHEQALREGLVVPLRPSLRLTNKWQVRRSEATIATKSSIPM